MTPKISLKLRILRRRLIGKLRYSFFKWSRVEDWKQAIVVFMSTLTILLGLLIITLIYSDSRFLSPSTADNISNILIGSVAVTSLYIAAKKFLYDNSHDISVKWDLQEGENELIINNRGRNQVTVERVKFYSLRELEEDVYRLERELMDINQPLDVSESLDIDLGDNLVFLDHKIKEGVQYTTSTGKRKTNTRTSIKSMPIGSFEDEEEWRRLRYVFGVFCRREIITDVTISLEDVMDFSREELRDKVDNLFEELPVRDDKLDDLIF